MEVRLDESILVGLVFCGGYLPLLCAVSCWFGEVLWEKEDCFGVSILVELGFCGECSFLL